jgi:predicted carbohydrate-binding protein with CBM5 and CBM33 domain
VNHEIPLFGRTGYHVILGVWEAADEPTAAYQMIDVNILS